MKKMKKYISLLLSAAMVAAMTAGCGSSKTSDIKDTSTASASTEAAADESGTESTGTSTEVQVTPPSDLVESGKLTYAVAATFAPYEYADEDGNYVGFDIEMAKAMADLMGLDVEIMEMDFNGLISALQGDRCDIINSAMYIKPEREEQVDFVKYMYIGDTILVRAGNDLNIQSTDDLSGKTVAVTAGAVEELTCEAFNEDFESRGMDPITILQLPTSNDAVVAVQNAQADCMVYSAASAAYAMSQQPGVFETTTVFDTDTVIGIATRKGDTEMQEAIQKCLDILVENGTYDSLMEKYNLASDLSYFK